MATAKQKVLAQLEAHRGEALSGEALANELKVSRTAVWKAVKDLQKEGHCITAVSNRGYTLEPTSGLLTEPGIRQHLRRKELTLVVEKELVSTNTTARELAAKGAGHGTLVLAEHQTGGRGRRGRNFCSPEGTGLYLSMILRSPLPMEKVVLTTSAAAVAVCHAVQKVTGKDLAIKWVNDLFYNGRKCCGILTEAAADMETGGLDHLVVGVGLNLCPPKGGWPEEIKDIAGSLFESGEHPDRQKLAAAIADELLDLFEALPDTSFMQEYRARNLVPGKDIRIIQNGQSRPAHAESINDEGHLLVTLPDGQTEELSFGEVSIRF